MSIPMWNSGGNKIMVHDLKLARYRELGYTDVEPMSEAAKSITKRRRRTKDSVTEPETTDEKVEEV